MHRAPGTLAAPSVGGFAAWLLAKLRREGSGQQRLVVLERVTVAPRQFVALVEAEGKRLLVATSPDGVPAFYPLDGGNSIMRESRSQPLKGRVSW